MPVPGDLCSERLPRRVRLRYPKEKILDAAAGAASGRQKGNRID